MNKKYLTREEAAIAVLLGVDVRQKRVGNTAGRPEGLPTVPHGDEPSVVADWLLGKPGSPSGWASPEDFEFFIVEE